MNVEPDQNTVYNRQYSGQFTFRRKLINDYKLHILD